MNTILGKEEYLPLGARLILDGELVVFPTETVYGLGANALDAEAVKKIFIAKERPQDNPLIVHLARFEDIFKVAKEVPPLCYTLYEKYCPGPLTMILKKGDQIPYEVTAGRETVGVRFPNHKMAIDLIKNSAPIAAPSANLAKHISPTTALHAYEDLNGRVPLVLDGGECSVGIESTIIDLTGEKPTVLRPGAITVEELTKVCDAENYHGELGIALAPGMKYKHYSPRCTCVMRKKEELLDTFNTAKNNNFSPVIIAREQTLQNLPTVNFLSLGSNGEEAAQRLYKHLHTAEKSYDYIILEELPLTGVFYSVMNRAKKSAGEKP